MMTGGSAAHVTIALNLAIALRHALRGTGCRPFGSDMKVIANRTVRCPDISITCRPVDDRDYEISDPVLVIEVPSASRAVALRATLCASRSAPGASLSRPEQVERAVDREGLDRAE